MDGTVYPATWVYTIDVEDPTLIELERNFAEAIGNQCYEDATRLRNQIADMKYLDFDAKQKIRDKLPKGCWLRDGVLDLRTQRVYGISQKLYTPTTVVSERKLKKSELVLDI